MVVSTILTFYKVKLEMFGNILPQILGIDRLGEPRGKKLTLSQIADFLVRMQPRLKS